VSDPWLAQLQQLHDDDKAKHEVKKPKKPEKPPESQANELLRKSQAHQAMRDVQKFLLNGGGTLNIFNRDNDYEGGVTLAWQGPISEARKPDINDPDPYYYIVVGVRKNALWVNGKRLADARPATLKTALLAAAQNPQRETRNKP
jgi:hypothetical protein